MGNKGCWTCRGNIQFTLYSYLNQAETDFCLKLNTARKVKCDLNRPVCDKCAKARQTCRGFGIQLSWPRETDKRRAIVNHNIARPRANSRSQQKGDRVFLNTSYWDVSLSDALIERRDLGNSYLLWIPTIRHICT
ncbi:hypothetical protein N7495_009116 [Penicillium taxi]|uniref:uncharacterized protein n=1 Tax=Penicillium taxi TaxID=168475 RepID=UPI002545A428|nr:uncharacterized protein N7495_009116 [Penicillium taxi]KAJ5889075.1 hypothetical protein N7495_009116 [Penicillium taxi]